MAGKALGDSDDAVLDSLSRSGKVSEHQQVDGESFFAPSGEDGDRRV